MEAKYEIRSKLVDGLLAGGVLVLLEMMLILLLKPIQLIFESPGLLVYTVILIALSAICLERSLAGRDSELTRAWWGVLAGLSAWVVIALSNKLGGLDLISETGILNLILALLVASVVWRRIAPLGLRYFFLLTFLGWLGQMGLEAMTFLSAHEPRLNTVTTGLGYLAGAVLVVAFIYIFTRSRTRLDRLNAALVIWFAATVMIYVFRGGFI